MAKRKKTAPRRRRRMSGVSAAGLAPTLGGAALGIIAGRLVASKLLANMDAKISAAIQSGAGIFLAMQRQPLIKGVGVGMFANGVLSLGTSMNLLSGIGNPQSSFMQTRDNEMPVIGDMGLNFLGNPQGSADMQVISGLGKSYDGSYLAGDGAPQGYPSMSVINGCDLLS